MRAPRRGSRHCFVGAAFVGIGFTNLGVIAEGVTLTQPSSAFSRCLTPASRHRRTDWIGVMLVQIAGAPDRRELAAAACLGMLASARRLWIGVFPSSYRSESSMNSPATHRKTRGNPANDRRGAITPAAIDRFALSAVSLHSLAGYTACRRSHTTAIAVLPRHRQIVAHDLLLHFNTRSEAGTCGAVFTLVLG